MIHKLGRAPPSESEAIGASREERPQASYAIVLARPRPLRRKALIRDCHTSTASRVPYCRNSLARGDSIRRHAAEQPIPQDQRVKQNSSKMGDEREEYRTRRSCGLIVRAGS